MADTQDMLLIITCHSMSEVFPVALSVAPVHSVIRWGDLDGQSTVSLLPEPGFIAKNQLPHQVTSWVKIPVIDHLIPEDSRENCAMSGNFIYRLVSNIRCTSDIRRTPTFGNSQLEFSPTINSAKTSNTRCTPSFDS